MSPARLVTFSTTLVFSLIVMSLSADFVSVVTVQNTYSRFSGFALATSLLTLLTVGPMFFVDWYRRGSFFSYIIVEVSWLSILWVFWLTSGSYSAWTNHEVYPVGSCDFGPFDDTDSRLCSEIRAIMAFSFLLWILLMFYTVLLLVLALRAQNQGHNVWTTGVRDGTLFYPRPNEKFVGGTPQVVPPQPVVYQSQPYYPPQAQQPAHMSVPMSVPQTYPAQV